MSGVVRRCPNCGTTTTSPGECQACHEAEVRYYCTNHSPGIWLDTPQCPQCGARYGEAARPTPVAPARSAARSTPARPTSSPSPSPRPAAPSAPPRTAPTITSPRSPWGRRKRAASPDYRETSDDGLAGRGPVVTSLPDLLRTASRMRRTPWGTAPAPDATPVEFPLGGCLRRAIYLAIFLFILFVIASVLIGGSLMQSFDTYTY